MKITIYELLGLVKDGKAPKKIKVTGHIYEYDEEFNFYLTETKNGRVCLGGLSNEINLLVNCFNEEKVEILEEQKKIPEKIFLEDIYAPSVVKAIDMELENKINEIIDYLESKGE